MRSIRGKDKKYRRKIDKYDKKINNLKKISGKINKYIKQKKRNRETKNIK